MEIEDEELTLWENCPTPDCEYKICRWAGTGYCYPCSRRILGLSKEEMDKRYIATHDKDGRWTGESYA